MRVAPNQPGEARGRLRVIPRASEVIARTPAALCKMKVCFEDQLLALSPYIARKAATKGAWVPCAS